LAVTGEQLYFEFDECLYSIENNHMQLKLAKSTSKTFQSHKSVRAEVFTFRKSITQDFKTASELLHNAKIDGRLIHELWEYLEI